MSAELAKTKPGADREGARTILCDDDPVFVLYRVASRYGLPVASEWAPWFMRELNQRKAITPLLGLGCSPVLVRGNKQTFLRWIGRALRERLIRIPAENGSIAWRLPRTFLKESNLQPTVRGETSRRERSCRLADHPERSQNVNISAFVGTNPPTRKHYFRFARHSGASALDARLYPCQKRTS